MKKMSTAKKAMPKYQAKKSQVVRKNPFGKDFGQVTDPYFKENVKTDYARPYYIKSDSFKVEGNKKRDAERKNWKTGKNTNWEEDYNQSERNKALGDKLRRMQKLPTRNMEWDYKKGGMTKKKMGGMTKSKKK